MTDTSHDSTSGTEYNLYVDRVRALEEENEQLKATISKMETLLREFLLLETESLDVKGPLGASQFGLRYAEWKNKITEALRSK